MQNPELTFVRRKDRSGRQCIAPFIDGWNVWDIPVANFDYATEKAILRAYELGFQAALERVRAINEPVLTMTAEPFNFKEVPNE
jgi:hypothetical protein